MAWCDANRVDYLFGLARNERLEEAIKAELLMAAVESVRTGKSARCFKDFMLSTLDSWSCHRRVIGKAEVTGGEANPRFVVTSLKPAEIGGRGEMETASKSASSTCSPIARRRPRCAPTSCASGSPRWPMYCCAHCAGS